jgi:hypothetical protein
MKAEEELRHSWRESADPRCGTLVSREGRTVNSDSGKPQFYEEEKEQ